ncbi:helix-turn-helix domain-containing protein [Isoalcanivorax indicus]|uniref:helix-turn-helix domain-containing protein n=1 Tax=Isoalcanivorax indicus TaxID=2202653 RepID=UPI000DBAD9AF|nr:AraC family transcriptional regulator [Isoalcanivorax indicus]
MTITPALQLYLWPDRLLFIGPGLDTHAHRHHAAQLCISLDASPVQIRADNDDLLAPGPAFFIPSDTSHQIMQHQGLLAMFYFDPESQECEVLAQHLIGEKGGRIAPVNTSALPLDQLRALAEGQHDVALANDLCNALPGLSAVRADRIDPRLQRVLDWLGDHLETPVRLAALARIAQASESWLAHAFTDTIGIPVRRYVLWRRLRRAIETALDGASLTEAAHHAGFSDAAHLSRTFRDNFGVTPSFLFARRDQMFVMFCDRAD